MSDAKLGDELLCDGALTGTRSSEQYEVHEQSSSSLFKESIVIIHLDLAFELIDRVEHDATMMRMDVPPNAWIRWLPVKEKMIEGTMAMSAKKDSAGKRDLVERVLDVGRGSPTRTDARNKATLLLKVVSRVIGG